MGRIKRIALCLFIFLSACNSYKDPDQRLFVIGRWGGEFLQGTGNSSYWMKCELEFLPFNILLVDIPGSEDGVSGQPLSYQFVNKDRITIKGRIFDEVQIERVGQDLIIKSLYGFPPNGRYKRIPSVLEWLIVILLIGIIAFVIMKFMVRRYLYKKSKEKME